MSSSQICQTLVADSSEEFDDFKSAAADYVAATPGASTTDDAATKTVTITYPQETIT